MKVKDWSNWHWEAFGRFRAATLEIEVALRHCCVVADAGSQFVFWLMDEGKDHLIYATNGLIARWKIEFESGKRNNSFRLPNRSFDEVKKSCNFSGFGQNTTETIHPSVGLDYNVVPDFEEVASPDPLTKDGVAALLASHGLRAAKPIEFLAWLDKNPEAGCTTLIVCPTEGEDGEYLSCVRCGQGTRGLWPQKPEHRDNKHWKATTVFLGVKIKQ